MKKTFLMAVVSIFAASSVFAAAYEMKTKATKGIEVELDGVIVSGSQTVNLAGRVGVMEGLDVNLNLPVFNHVTGANTFMPSDGNLGATYDVMTGDHNLAVKLNVGLPFRAVRGLDIALAAVWSMNLSEGLDLFAELGLPFTRESSVNTFAVTLTPGVNYVAGDFMGQLFVALNEAIKPATAFTMDATVWAGYKVAACSVPFAGFSYTNLTNDVRAWNFQVGYRHLI